MNTPKQSRRKFCMAGAAGVAALLCGASAWARPAGYPAKPLTLIVPWPAGGATDIVARVLGDRLQAYLGQPVIIENRPGATGYIGSQAALRAPDDGYTLLMMAASVHSFSPAVMRNMPFDPIKDFQPISQAVTFPYVMVVPADSPFKSVTDVLQAARVKPGGISYGSIGTGSASHMISELLAITSGTKLLHVPYKGGAQALQDLMGGQFDFLIDSLPSPLPHIKSGRLRALAVTSAERVAAIPEVPSLSEILPGFEAISWLGVGCAPGVAPDIAARLGEAMRKVGADPVYIEKIRGIGAEPEVSATPDAFVAFLESEQARWKKVAVDAAIPMID